MTRTSIALGEYTEALERLKTGSPIRVSKGTPINNDSVSLEAGRHRGSIKRSRPAFAELLAAIDQAAAANPPSLRQAQAGRIGRARRAADDFRSRWEAALERELALLLELYELKRQLSQLSGANVLPLRPALRRGVDDPE